MSQPVIGYKLDPVRVVIVDEDLKIQRHLRDSLLNERSISVVGSIHTITDLADLNHGLTADVLLVDLNILKASEAYGGSCKVSRGSTRVIATVDKIDRESVIELIRYSSHGIVAKTAPSRVFVDAIQTVIAGHYWLDEHTADIVVSVLCELLPRNQGSSSKDFGLTRRELAIVAKIASGSSNRQVGQEFSISERTVKHHLTNIFEKIGVSTRLELALFAVNHQLTGGALPSQIHALSPAVSAGKES